MKKMRWASALAVVMCVLLLAACSSNSGPASTVKAFSQALANGDADTASSLMYYGTVDQNKVALVKAMMGVMVKLAKAKFDAEGGLDSINVTDVDKTDDKHATVTFTLHLGNGGTRTNQAHVVYHDGKWLVTK